MRPLIGIPQCLDAEGRWRPGREYQYLDTTYARVVEAAGGIPLHLPLQRDAAALIERVDGLLLPGGDDLRPERPYPPRVRFDPVPERQLAFDRALLSAALERDRPLLSICYGMQLLALHCGGSLHYDIPTDVPAAGAHRLPEADGRHSISVEAGTRLAAILGGASLRVNSLHHQAVAEPGGALRVAARADDGLIEALELPGTPFVVGVQWHPEKMDGPHCDRLFRAFVEACSAPHLR